MYEGFWEMNKAKGEGRLIMHNQDYYLGEFDDDYINGKGTMYSANGIVKSGNWKNGTYIEEDNKSKEDKFSEKYGRKIEFKHNFENNKKDDASQFEEAKSDEVVLLNKVTAYAHPYK